MSVKELSSAPGAVTLYPRAVAGSMVIPALRRLPGIGRRFRLDGGLPDLELVLPETRVDRAQLVEYDRVCGFRLRDVLPATYPHVLAFPLSMELMTDTSFPFPVIGLVHVGNRITQPRPIGAEEQLEVHVRTAGLEPHDRGTQFQIVAEASAGDEPAWRGESTYLHREAGGGGGAGKKGARSPEVLERSAVWEVSGDTGRRYASVSGDRNLIHLHPLTARLFGLPRPIAHGMWLKARCLAALESSLPEAYAADVRFKLPLYLPGKVAFGSRREDGGWAFSVSDADSGKPHLVGSVEPV